MSRGPALRRRAKSAVELALVAVFAFVEREAQGVLRLAEVADGLAGLVQIREIHCHLLVGAQEVG